VDLAFAFAFQDVSIFATSFMFVSEKRRDTLSPPRALIGAVVYLLEKGQETHASDDEHHTAGHVLQIEPSGASLSSCRGRHGR
jgi:hypothetical protein